MFQKLGANFEWLVMASEGGAGGWFSGRPRRMGDRIGGGRGRVGVDYIVVQMEEEDQIVVEMDEEQDLDTTVGMVTEEEEESAYNSAISLSRSCSSSNSLSDPEEEDDWSTVRSRRTPTILAILPPEIRHLVFSMLLSDLPVATCLPSSAIYGWDKVRSRVMSC